MRRARPSMPASSLMFQRRAERSPRLAFATAALTTPDLEGRVTAGMRAAAEATRELDCFGS